MKTENKARKSIRPDVLEDAIRANMADQEMSIDEFTKYLLELNPDFQSTFDKWGTLKEGYGLNTDAVDDPQILQGLQSFIILTNFFKVNKQQQEIIVQLNQTYLNVSKVQDVLTQKIDDQTTALTNVIEAQFTALQAQADTNLSTLETDLQEATDKIINAIP